MSGTMRDFFFHLQKQSLPNTGEKYQSTLLHKNVQMDKQSSIKGLGILKLTII